MVKLCNLNRQIHIQMKLRLLGTSVLTATWGFFLIEIDGPQLCQGSIRLCVRGENGVADPKCFGLFRVISPHEMALIVAFFLPKFIEGMIGVLDVNFFLICPEVLLIISTLKT